MHAANVTGILDGEKNLDEAELLAGLHDLADDLKAGLLRGLCGGR
jgi:hypothetical protein